MKIGGRGRCAAYGRSLRRYCSSSSPLMGWEPAATALFRRRPAQHCYSRTAHTTLAIALFCASKDRGEEHHRRAPLLPPHNTIGKTGKTASYRRSPCMTSLLAYRGDDRPLLTGNLRGGYCVEREGNRPHPPLLLAERSLAHRRSSPPRRRSLSLLLARLRRTEGKKVAASGEGEVATLSSAAVASFLPGRPQLRMPPPKSREGIAALASSGHAATTAGVDRRRRDCRGECYLLAACRRKVIVAASREKTKVEGALPELKTAAARTSSLGAPPTHAPMLPTTTVAIAERGGNRPHPPLLLAERSLAHRRSSPPRRRSLPLLLARLRRTEGKKVAASGEGEVATLSSAAVASFLPGRPQLRMPPPKSREGIAALASSHHAATTAGVDRRRRDCRGECSLLAACRRKVIVAASREKTKVEGALPELKTAAARTSSLGAPPTHAPMLPTTAIAIAERG
nr:hypothetical protein Iba_chr02fCG8840 [Ipomoea batatas]